MANIYTVAKVNSYIKAMFSQDFLLTDVSVKGEISNLKYHSSGHIYFTLKDDKSAISCVMFAGMRSGLNFRLYDGLSVVVRGNVDVYERDGKYQIYAKSIKEDGAGELYERFLKLKEELSESGMFAPEYKKTLPRYVKRLGVVTAKTGAAIQDIINIATRRNPYIEIILYPALVQGENAAESIVKGIKALEKYGVDVMIVGRGGGSIEDLWAFNERIVAEAVFDSSIPIISAVGHETDTTIIDFVSDLRAPTPSAAAELAVVDVIALIEELFEYKNKLGDSIYRRINESKNQLKLIESELKRKSPESRLRESRMRLINLEEHLGLRMNAKISQNRNRLLLYTERLKGLSPLDKLNQGYSYAESDGNTVNSIEKIHVNDDINIHVKDGIIKTRVTEICRKK